MELKVHTYIPLSDMCKFNAIHALILWRPGVARLSVLLIFNCKLASFSFGYLNSITVNGDQDRSDSFSFWTKLSQLSHFISFFSRSGL